VGSHPFYIIELINVLHFPIAGSTVRYAPSPIPCYYPLFLEYFSALMGISLYLKIFLPFHQSRNRVSTGFIRWLNQGGVAIIGIAIHN
jgi:hypothetical protein